MFFWRKDSKLLARARTRVRSARGAVFAEFALLAPILVLLISAMIEIAGFFDAQVMANHTAWTIGRQATVHMDELAVIKTEKKVETITGYNSHFTSPAKNPWEGGLFEELGLVVQGLNNLRDHGRITAVMLMSTCGMGYFGKTPGQFSADLLKKALISPIKKLVEQLASNLKEKLKIKIELPFGIADFLNKIISEVINKLFEKIVNPIVDKLTGAIAKKLEEIIGPIDEKLDSNVAWARRIKQIYGAAQRAVHADHLKSVYSISYPGYKLNKDAFIDWETYRIDQQHNPLSFPAAFCAANKPAPTIKNYVVSGYTGWPPNGQFYPVMRVDVKWPYSKMWMFPVVSGMGKEGKTIIAQGSSLVFSQPMIDNDFLKSEGAKAYPGSDQDNDLALALEKIAKLAKQYLEVMIFALEYRIRTEVVDHHEHHRDGIHNDHFYKPLIYFWFDRNKVDTAEYGAEPWGSVGSCQAKTIRDRSIGYTKTAHEITGTWDVYTEKKKYSVPVRGDRQRFRYRYFWWETYKNPHGKLRSRYPIFDSHNARYFNQGERNLQLSKLAQILRTIYLPELKDALNGGSGSGTKGPGNLIDFSDAKDLDLSNKQAVIDYFNKRWTKMKKGIEDAYEALDAHVAVLQDRARDFDAKIKQWVKLKKTLSSLEKRRKWAITKKRKKRLDKEIRNCKSQIAGLEQDCWRLSNQLESDINRAKDLEDELCMILGSASAAKYKGKSIDDVIDDRGKKPDDGRDPNPFRPGDDIDPIIQRDEWRWSPGKGWQ